MKLSYKRRILVSFVVASVLLLAIGISVLANFGEMRKQKEAVDHTYEVIGTVSNILSLMKDVQSSQRGYVIAHEESYLDPYNAAISKLDQELLKMDRLLSDNPEQMRRAADLKEHVRDRLAVAKNVIEMVDKSGQGAAISAVKKGSGKNLMDEMRVIVAEMISHEQLLLKKRQDALRISSNVTNFSNLLGLGICFIILVAVFILIDREAALRAETEESLQRALSQMETITQETKMISKIGDYLRGCRNEEEAYEIIKTNMPTLFPQTYGSVSVFNNSRNLLQAVVSWGDLPPISRDFAPEDCWALRQGRIHQSMNDGVVPMCQHLTGIEGRACSVCLPMQAQGETLGQIYLGSASTDAMSEHQLATLRNIGEQVSLALANLELQRALREQSIKDPLTKLFNRRYLEETLVRETARAQRNEQNVAALVMDIDHFKKVNDTYGHDGGDAVLVAFSKMLASSVRKEDIACRMGGEEFVLVLPSADLEQAIMRAEEICAQARLIRVSFQGRDITVTVSIGVASYPAMASTDGELIRNADLALYAAKSRGRDRAVAYDPSAQDMASRA